MQNTITTNWYNQGLFAAGLVRGLNIKPTTTVMGAGTTATRSRSSTARRRTSGARGLPAVGAQAKHPLTNTRKRTARRRGPALQT